MGAILYDVSEEGVWLVANWVFERFVEDLITVAPEDEEWRSELEQCCAMRAITLASYWERNPEMGMKLLRTIKQVANATLVGAPADSNLHWKNGLDEAGRGLYLKGIQNLLDVIAFYDDLLKSLGREY